MNQVLLQQENNAAMAIHTFTYGFRVSSETYFALFDLLIKKRAAHKTDYFVKYTTTDYRSLGINRIEFTTYDPQSYNPVYYINFTINPRILTGEYTKLYTRIIEKANLKKLPITVSSVLTKLCNISENILNDGKFRRIDYCCNLWFYDQETAEIYLYLLKQAKIPHRFKVKKYYNQKQKRSTPETFAITISCKSYELSIYLKYPQLQIKNAQGYLDDPQELNNALGQLRIELREQRTKLLSDKKKCHCTESELLDGTNTRPRETLCKLLKQMYGAGDFLLYSDAREQIANSRYSKGVKRKMLNVLCAVKKRHGLDSQKNHLDPDILSGAMPYFNELDISPITLSEKKAKYCSEEVFPNPLKYIQGETMDLLADTDVLQVDQLDND